MSKGLPNRISDVDYIVVAGTVYSVERDHFADEAHLKEMDEIPEEYFDRWADQ